MKKWRLVMFFFFSMPFAFTSCNLGPNWLIERKLGVDLTGISEIRYHQQVGDHCETIRVFLPKIDKVALLKKRDIGIVIASPAGVFRAKFSPSDLSTDTQDSICNGEGTLGAFRPRG